MSLLLLVLLAAPQTLTADQYLDEGRQFFRKLEPEKAIQALEAGLSASPSATTKAQLLLYLGLVRFDLLDPTGAGEAFRRAIGTEPSLALPANANPRAAALFSEARTKSRAEQKARAPELLWQKVGLFSGAAGIAALGVGLGLGYSASFARGEAAASPSALNARGRLQMARDRAHWANGLFIAGAALTIGGGAVVLWSSTQGAGVAIGGPW